MDETWDMWNVTKNPYDYAQDFMENYETDIQSIVAKDYNHPSVIMYSIGNEVTEPHKGTFLLIPMFLPDRKHTFHCQR